MGKKKGRQQQSSNTPIAVDSSESGDAQEPTTNVIPANNKSICQHVTRAVDINNLKKNISASENQACARCIKLGIVPVLGDGTWFCLRCGHRACSLKHAEEHHEVPRSDSHCLAIQLPPFIVRCHNCKMELPDDFNKKLNFCITNLKQMHMKGQLDLKSEPSSTENKEKEKENQTIMELNSETIVEKKKVIPRTPFQPAVRGLSNLGNTCFFNSVLQCLARTPNLVDVLKEMNAPKQPIDITLKSGKHLVGKLDKWDALSESLVETLESLLSIGGGVFSPYKLLNLLRKKCPQFEGYDQHDAHELLRHLLDAVRTNDLKRYRKVMLAEMGLSSKVNPQEVSEEKTKQLKQLDHEVCEAVTLVPEHVFKGLLVSTLECQECNSTSQCVESFLDLSLPVMSEKPQPPSCRRKNNSSAVAMEEKGGSQISKHQLKKERKMARKNKGKKHAGVSNCRKDPSHQAEPTIPENDEKGSDAEGDIEDNEEAGCCEDKRHESGYSSEKLGGSVRETPSVSSASDSARASPSSITAHLYPVLPLDTLHPAQQSSQPSQDRPPIPLPPPEDLPCLSLSSFEQRPPIPFPPPEPLSPSPSEEQPPVLLPPPETRPPISFPPPRPLSPTPSRHLPPGPLSPSHSEEHPSGPLSPSHSEEPPPIPLPPPETRPISFPPPEPLSPSPYRQLPPRPLSPSHSEEHPSGPLSPSHSEEQLPIPLPPPETRPISFPPPEPLSPSPSAEQPSIPFPPPEQRQSISPQPSIPFPPPQQIQTISPPPSEERPLPCPEIGAPIPLPPPETRPPIPLPPPETSTSILPSPLEQRPPMPLPIEDTKPELKPSADCTSNQGLYICSGLPPIKQVPERLRYRIGLGYDWTLEQDATENNKYKTETLSKPELNCIQDTREETNGQEKFHPDGSPDLSKLLLRNSKYPELKVKIRSGLDVMKEDPNWKERLNKFRNWSTEPDKSGKCGSNKKVDHTVESRFITEFRLFNIGEGTCIEEEARYRAEGVKGGGGGDVDINKSQLQRPTVLQPLNTDTTVKCKRNKNEKPSPKEEKDEVTNEDKPEKINIYEEKEGTQFPTVFHVSRIAEGVLAHVSAYLQKEKDTEASKEDGAKEECAAAPFGPCLPPGGDVEDEGLSINRLYDEGVRPAEAPNVSSTQDSDNIVIEPMGGYSEGNGFKITVKSDNEEEGEEEIERKKNQTRSNGGTVDDEGLGLNEEVNEETKLLKGETSSGSSSGMVPSSSSRYLHEEGECSVLTCLNQFTSIELMTGNNKVGCSTCTSRMHKGSKDGKTVYTMSTKQLLIKKVPPVLILHLKRFQVQMYSFRKLSRHVSFPMVLDLAPFCVDSDKLSEGDEETEEDRALLYSLYGVVEHSGTFNGGHYVAYVKVDDSSDDNNGSRWYCISDSHVLEVTESRVLSSQAYLLFYRRMAAANGPT